MSLNMILFGTGWRAMFYLRIAKALPDLLSIHLVYTRREEMMRDIEAMGFKATMDLEEALSSPGLDGAILASGRSNFMEIGRALKARGIPIFAETTFLELTREEQDEFIGVEGVALEQYQYVPLYAAVIASLPLIGRVSQLTLSHLHNHHAAAIARKILSTDDEIPPVMKYDFKDKILKTGGRYGMERGGDAEEYTRKIRIMEFSDHRLFIDDFSTNQYHSYLIPRRIEVRGERGVINQNGTYYVNDDGEIIKEHFFFHRDSSELNQSLSLSHITLGDKVLWRNPFYGVNLNDDEVAIATILKLYSEGGPCYSLYEGILDARLGVLL